MGRTRINIGNRTLAVEDSDSTAYEANALNQYTSVSENNEEAFVPQFDADGNQTLIKTATGIWSAVYNAENRPAAFSLTEKDDTVTLVSCAYDSMGRRCFKKVTANGTVTLHERYLYRGYLQIAAVNLLDTAQPIVHAILWDPSQPIATRPLAIRKGNAWYAYGWDLTKNICELFASTGTLAVSYAYTPFGTVTANGDIEQPIQWSSEYRDSKLSLVYYNYRHYTPLNGGWVSRDFIYGNNMYMKDNTILSADLLGLEDIYITVTYSYNVKFTYRNVNSNKFYVYGGFVINDKYKVTETVNIDCNRRGTGEPVLGLKVPNYARVMEGNHIDSVMLWEGWGSYAYDAVKESFEGLREHWSGKNKYIKPMDNGSITDKDTQGEYYVIDVNSAATAYRDPISSDSGSSNHSVIREVGVLGATMARKYKPVNVIFRLSPIVEEIAWSRSYTKELPEKSEAAVNAQVWACCDSDNKLMINYKAAKGTSLPIGSALSRNAPGSIDLNSAKFTVDIDVTVK